MSQNPAIEMVYHTAPDCINEDAYIIMPTELLSERIIVAAIDGATTRLTPPRMQAHLDSLPITLTPAAYAARFIRDSLVRHITSAEKLELRALMLAANADLNVALIDIFGELTLDAMQFPAETYTMLKNDPRLVRLIKSQ